jgi:DNA-binding Lrp family transcriptional regulator
MKELKDLDYKILFELMKNSRLSDRQLARRLDVSQPTITRRRAMLEKELIEGYTTIPKWEKLGYEIFAMTFFKIRTTIASKERYEVTRKRGMQWLMNQPNVIMAGACRGIGMDAFNLSFHKSYSDYDEWMRKFRLEMAEFVEDIQSVLVNLAGKELLKPLNMRYLAEPK